MRCTKEQIVLNMSTPNPHEFVEDFRNSVLEIVGLLCEGRELDLHEPQLYALNLLARSAVAIQVKGAGE